MKKKILALVMAAAMTLGCQHRFPERRLRQQCERVRL